MNDVHIVRACPLVLLLFIAAGPYRMLPVKSLFADTVTGKQGVPEKNVLFASDLETQPLAAGWKREARGGDSFDGEWKRGRSASGEHYVVIRRGYVQSPDVAVRPFCYYQVRFAKKVAFDGHWSVQFFDRRGEALVADNYDSIYAACEWRQQEGCLRAPAQAARMVVRFHGGGSGVAIDDVEIRRIGWRDAAAWCDRVAASVPVVNLQPPERRWKRLPETMAALRSGERLRIVMLGDSICNDISNSLYETLLRRHYPNAKPCVIPSVRGGMCFLRRFRRGRCLAWNFLLISFV